MKIIIRFVRGHSVPENIHLWRILREKYSKTYSHRQLCCAIFEYFSRNLRSNLSVCAAPNMGSLTFYIRFLGCLLISSNGFATAEKCSNLPILIKNSCLRLHQIWDLGSIEAYIPGYAWHNRFTYSREKIKTYNELALGGGLGKGFFDEKGDWHGLMAFAFLDSHKNVEPLVGYAFLKVANLGENTKVGLGYTLFLTMRPDINHNIPFPGLLPWAGLTYQRLSIYATYIPGTRTNGNVLFLLAKWTFKDLN